MAVQLFVTRLYFSYVFLNIEQLTIKTYFIPEPNGRIQSSIQDNYHISMVPELISHSIPQQEGSSRGENYAFTSCRLFPRI